MISPLESGLIHRTGSTNRLLLRYDVECCVDGGVASLDLDDSIVKIHGIPADRAAAIVACIDDGLEVNEIADAAGCDGAVVDAFVRRLVELGVASPMPRPGDGDTCLPPQTVAELCRRLFPAWKDQLFEHALWRSLADGSAARGLAIGWLIESYHFIEGVTLRLPTAIAACRDPDLRRHFIRHFAEEFDHHHFFAKALRSFGIDGLRLRQTRPLPGTLAVLNHMRDSARRDFLAYAACSAFLESTGGDRSRAHDFLSLVNEHYGTDSATFKPLVDHLNLDGDYGHAGFLESLCARLGPVQRSRVDLALQCARGLVETLLLWSSDILDHYSKPESMEIANEVRIYRLSPRCAQ